METIYSNRLKITTHFEKYFFVFVFAIGATSIITAKGLHADQFTTTAIPIAIMIAYIIYILRFSQARARDDKSGDNIYYLGFLFTLVSLACTLYQFSADDTSAYTIVSNFGIALFTTITGLLGRIFFLQFKASPIVVEDRIKEEFWNTAAYTIQRMHELSSEFNSYIDIQKQITTDYYSDLTAKSNDFFSELKNNITELSNQSTTTISMTSSAHIESNAQLAKDISNLMTTSAQTFNTALDESCLNFTTGINNISKESSKAARNILELSDVFNSISSDYRTQCTELLQIQRDYFKKISKSFQTHHDKIITLSIPVVEINSSLASFTEISKINNLLLQEINHKLATHLNNERTSHLSTSPDTLSLPSDTTENN